MLSVCRNPFCFCRPVTPVKEGCVMNKEKKKTTAKEKQKDVVAYRKSCKPKGTGLSHYILMDKKTK